MKLSVKQYAQALYEALCDTQPQDHDRIMENFVKILQESRQTERYPEIEKEAMILYLKEKGEDYGQLTLARDIDLTKDLLQKLNQATKSKLKLEKKVDKDKIGGVIIRADDKLIDASVKSQVIKLNEELKK